MALNTETSVVDYLKSTGKDASLSARAKLAQQMGIANYAGTSAQNVQLLSALKTKGAPMPGVQPVAPQAGTPQVPVTQVQTPSKVTTPPVSNGTPPPAQSLTPPAPTPFQRDYAREAAVLKKNRKDSMTGISPTEKELLSRMTYRQDELDRMSPEDLAQLGIKDSADPYGVTKGFEAANAKLAGTPEPTNMSLRVLEDALRMKSDPSKQKLGESELYKSLGISGYEVLDQSLQQRSREMNDRFVSFTQGLSNVASDQVDRFKLASNQYKLAKDIYDEKMKEVTDYNSYMRDFDKALTLMEAEQANRKEMADYTNEIQQRYGKVTWRELASGDQIATDEQGNIVNQIDYKGRPSGASKNIPNEPPVAYTIGNKQVKTQPLFQSALVRADQDMFAATGQHIQINESFRTHERQQQLYNELSKKGARVAKPGSSFHEKGLAVDVQNYQEAAPYLKKYGITNGLEDDMGHFSMGEMNEMPAQNQPSNQMFPQGSFAGNVEKIATSFASQFKAKPIPEYDNLDSEEKGRVDKAIKIYKEKGAKNVDDDVKYPLQVGGKLIPSLMDAFQAKIEAGAAGTSSTETDAEIAYLLENDDLFDGVDDKDGNHKPGLIELAKGKSEQAKKALIKTVLKKALDKEPVDSQVTKMLEALNQKL